MRDLACLMLSLGGYRHADARATPPVPSYGAY